MIGLLENNLGFINNYMSSTKQKVGDADNLGEALHKKKCSNTSFHVLLKFICVDLGARLNLIKNLFCVWLLKSDFVH